MVEVIIKVEPENTEYKQAQNSNVIITSNLTPIWNEIKECNKFNIQCKVFIPAIVENEPVVSRIIVIDSFFVSDIEAARTGPDSEVLVTQMAYYEGNVDYSRSIIGNSLVWAYDLY